MRLALFLTVFISVFYLGNLRFTQKLAMML